MSVEMLLSRTSVKRLVEPAPGDAELKIILDAAVRAPDHGKLRPWRFLVIRGEARVRLSELFAKFAGSEGDREKEREKPLRSPLLVAVAARLARGHKIPEIEQILAAGAAAMNILNAVHALGYGAKWVTGANCYSPDFKAAMGLGPDDHLLGFIHIGTPAEPPSPVARPDSGQFVTEW